jgi:hypothetical protein
MIVADRWRLIVATAAAIAGVIGALWLYSVWQARRDNQRMASLGVAAQQRNSERLAALSADFDELRLPDAFEPVHDCSLRPCSFPYGFLGHWRSPMAPAATARLLSRAVRETSELVPVLQCASSSCLVQLPEPDGTIKFLIDPIPHGHGSHVAALAV